MKQIIIVISLVAFTVLPIHSASISLMQRSMVLKVKALRRFIVTAKKKGLDLKSLSRCISHASCEVSRDRTMVSIQVLLYSTIMVCQQDCRVP